MVSLFHPLFCHYGLNKSWGLVFNPDAAIQRRRCAQCHCARALHRFTHIRVCGQEAEWARLLVRALRALAAAPANRATILDSGALADLCTALSTRSAWGAAAPAAETLGLLAGDARTGALADAPLRALLALLTGNPWEGGHPVHGVGSGGFPARPSAQPVAGGKQEGAAAAAAAAGALAGLVQAAPNRCSSML